MPYRIAVKKKKNTKKPTNLHLNTLKMCMCKLPWLNSRGWPYLLCKHNGCCRKMRPTTSRHIVWIRALKPARGSMQLRQSVVHITGDIIYIHSDLRWLKGDLGAATTGYAYHTSICFVSHLIKVALLQRAHFEFLRGRTFNAQFIAPLDVHSTRRRTVIHPCPCSSNRDLISSRSDTCCRLQKL